MSTDFALLPFIATARASEVGNDSSHTVIVGEVEHPSGVRQPAVEVCEHHEGAYVGRRRFAISTLVHLALNVREDEVWALAARDMDFVGAATNPK